MTPQRAYAIREQQVRDAEVHLSSARQTYTDAYRAFIARCEDADKEYQANLAAAERGM